MDDKRYILAIDQGTSSTKALIFDEQGQVMAKGSEPLNSAYLPGGLVEQDPEEIYANVVDSVRNCLHRFSESGFNKGSIEAIGIANQRETFVLWDKNGTPLHNAVVWQCKRSVEICEELKQQGISEMVRSRTGLLVDPYFSATKLIWLFRHNATVQRAIRSGDAFFGTVDTWLLYRLTNGAKFSTDYSNASRTLFFNLSQLRWDEELVDVYGLKGIRLPEVKASGSCYGETTLHGILNRPVAITAMIGDSHSAAFGEGCFEPGAAKATLGTGCSILMNVGSRPVESNNGMVSTVCWSAGNKVAYALEGVIVSCGATIEWLKNEIGLFNDSRETESMANAVGDNGGVYIVPAFSGLGSPHWQMERRASISGISFGTGKNHIVRAALESIPYQVMDVVTAMEKDAGIELKELMVDGGMTTNRFVLQYLANLLDRDVVSTKMPDVSALGAACIAGLEAGIFADFGALKKLEKNRNIYNPETGGQEKKAYEKWKELIGTQNS